MSRKYFQAGIDQLEALFKENGSNFSLLRELDEELVFRTTNRARKLRVAVQTRLQTKKTGSPPRESRADHQRASRESDSPTGESNSSDNRESALAGNTGAAQRREPKLPGPLPPVTNEAAQILDAWTALEVLSPPTFSRPEDLASRRDRRAVASIDQVTMPWEGDGEKSRPSYRLYYQVVLGTIRMAPAFDALIERFGDQRPERLHARGNAILAIVILDKKGRIIESPSVTISSFGWGVNAALEGELADLARWPSAETELVKRMDTHIRALCTTQQNDEEQVLRPVSRSTLLSLFHTLVEELRLPSDFVEAPRFAIRSYEYFKNHNPPEPLLLNSFFLRDLAAARKLMSLNEGPTNLCKYLGKIRSRERLDLLENRSALDEAVAPAKTQLARWPAAGRYPLVLLQQAAVNSAFSETERGGLLGINGPPGTGKTTLLRDVLAGVVTLRAEAMAKFDDPQDAFIHSGEKLKAGNGWLHLYRLDPTLRGFEMLVASSNNRAVENVSAEVPALNAIAADATELRYFKTISDALHSRDTWGMIAAVLGNAERRGHFRKTFWWDDDVGFNTYLASIAGSVDEVEAKDPETGVTIRRPPKIVTEEHPPTTHDIALVRWRAARQKFGEAVENARVWQKWLESIRGFVLRLPALRSAEAEAHREAGRTGAAVAEYRAGLYNAVQVRSAKERDQLAVNAQVSTHVVSRPGFWARLFVTAKAKKWKETYKRLLDQRDISERAFETAQQNAVVREAEMRTATVAAENAKQMHSSAVEAHCAATAKLSEARSRFGVTFADEEFFLSEHKAKQTTTPWFPAPAQRVRDEVFISAISLHRAFIDAAAKPIRNNLGALMNTLAAAPFPTAAKEKLLPDLWSSLFVVVPLISTTFASVNRMLGRLPCESLGWLLVDEAGQASPQAAVGALMRAKRVLIVGDPAQVEPVVMLPDSLTSAICLRFGVNPDDFGAPSASVQTLADSASTYKSEFPTRMGSRTVGAPLLVHRRCAEPMFGISNSVAYARLMVSATPARQSRIREILGPSRWLNVRGNGEDKWSQEEGEQALHLLRRLADARVEPDLYFVTPFVIVADRLREMIRASGILQTWQIDDDWRWTIERVGTIHTVQGREAEAVILVLGAPLISQTGARGWAGAKPNLLNVAATRAQEVLYVVGNRELWQHSGVFTELANRLPTEET